MKPWRWESTPPLDPDALGKPEGQKAWRVMLRQTNRIIGGIRASDDEVSSLSSPLWEWSSVIEWKPGDRILLGVFPSSGDARRAIDSALTGIQLQLAARNLPFDFTPVIVHEAIDNVNSCECEYCRPHSGVVDADMEGILDE